LVIGKCETVNSIEKYCALEQKMFIENESKYMLKMSTTVN